jgi:U3 small nucleolar RNA-associated protein 21
MDYGQFFERAIMTHDVSLEPNLKTHIFQIWDIRTEKCLTELEFPPSFEITALAHPPTYKDKILFGSRQGRLQVKN